MGSEGKYVEKQAYIRRAPSGPGSPTLVLEKGFVSGMATECHVFVPEAYVDSLLAEDRDCGDSTLKQLARMSSLPGIHLPPTALPDVHRGYGFPVGSACVFDMSSPDCTIAPESIGYDINCGVRFWTSTLRVEDFLKHREPVMDGLFEEIPVEEREDPAEWGLNMNEMLNRGLEYLREVGLIEDREIERTEFGGRILGADHRSMGQRPKHRGMIHLGTLGSGNHYLEIQYIDKIYDKEIAEKLGLAVGGVCLSVHSGSRGLGHRACSEYLSELEYNLHRDEGVRKINGHLTVRAHSPLGRKYMEMMAGAANYAFCNRALLGKRAMRVMKKHFPEARFDLFHDVSHNLLSVEAHPTGKLLFVRKGATRSYPPWHQEVPEPFKEHGYPVIVGGSMATRSYVLLGGKLSPSSRFSTCHGSGRILSRTEAHRRIKVQEVLEEMRGSEVSFRVLDESALVEECSKAYKDINEVAKYCEDKGINRRLCRLKPLGVLKG